MVHNEVGGFLGIFVGNDTAARDGGDEAGFTPRQIRSIQWMAAAAIGLMAAWWVVGAIIAR